MNAGRVRMLFARSAQRVATLYVLQLGDVDAVDLRRVEPEDPS
jgi:hypothetical protein